MVRNAMSGCVAVAMASAAMTGFAHADAGTAPASGAGAAPRVSVSPSAAKQKTAVTVKVTGAPKTCRSVHARSDAFVRTLTLAKTGNSPMYASRAWVKANARPGTHQVRVGGVGCGKWMAQAKLTVLAATTAPKVVKGKVNSKVGVNVRKQPTSNSAITGAYRNGQVINLVCSKAGQSVGGNRTWYRVTTPPGWVTARYVKAYGKVPVCK